MDAWFVSVHVTQIWQVKEQGLVWIGRRRSDRDCDRRVRWSINPNLKRRWLGRVRCWAVANTEWGCAESAPRPTFPQTETAYFLTLGLFRVFHPQQFEHRILEEKPAIGGPLARVTIR